MQCSRGHTRGHRPRNSCPRQRVTYFVLVRAVQQGQSITCSHGSRPMDARRFLSVTGDDVCWEESLRLRHHARVSGCSKKLGYLSVSHLAIRLGACRCNVIRQMGQPEMRTLRHHTLTHQMTAARCGVCTREAPPRRRMAGPDGAIGKSATGVVLRLKLGLGSCDYARCSPR